MSTDLKNVSPLNNCSISKFTSQVFPHKTKHYFNDYRDIKVERTKANMPEHDRTTTEPVVS